MSWWMTLLIFVLGLLGVAGCGLFAGLEMGIYSLNRVRLRLLSHQGEPRARLLEAMQRHPANVIATLLIGTNIATNIASSSLGVLLESTEMAHWKIVLYDVLIITPILFIFAEVLPKDLFAAYADTLVYPFARPLRWMQKALTYVPLLPLVRGVSELVMHFIGGRDISALAHPRHQMNLMVKEGVGLGLLSDEQSAIAERVLRLNEQTVGDVAVPWEKVIKVSIHDPPAVLWELANRTSVSRFPVIAPGGAVAGTVSLYDALWHKPEACPPLGELLKPAPTLDARMPLRAALSQMQTKGASLAIVTDRGRPSGLVTLKDLIEPITGELASW